MTEKNLTDKQKEDLRRRARMFLRACGFEVEIGDSPPLTIEVVDDDGNTIETLKK